MCKLWDLNQSHTLEQIIHYVGAICIKSENRSIKDAAIRRKAGVKIESR